MPRIARLLAFSALLAAGIMARAQNEGRIASDFRREGQALHACVTFKFADLPGCGETLFTGQPMHIAVGSLAPQNGVAAGLAFVEHKNLPSEWRLNWNADAVASGNGSWRAGAYMKSYKFRSGNIQVAYPSAPTSISSGTSRPKSTAPLYRSSAVFNLYAEGTSLRHVDFFGLGPTSTPAGHAVFGFTEGIVGASAIIPFTSKANLSFVGEINGRFPSVRGNHADPYPSIELLYNEASAPGLTQQAAFLQAGEGLRLRPSLFNDHLRLNYLGQFQQFVAPGASVNTFRRWNLDLDHQIPLYRTARLIAARDQNGPDDCSTSASPANTARPCPHISVTQNLEGSIDVRLLMTGSVANAGHAVPFYFDPTLGGSDINGNAALASYPDYRFRAPNLVLLRETFEHSLGKLPIGLLFTADQGNVANRRDDINFSHLRQSYGAGFTLRAGGLPMVYVLFAWGGGEGHHTSATISNALLGGSARPSLF